MQNRENLFKGSHHQNLENIHLSEFLNLIISTKNAHVLRANLRITTRRVFSRDSLLFYRVVSAAASTSALPI